MPVGHLHFLSGKMSFHFFCSFFNGLLAFLMLSSMSYLYMLDINCLSAIPLANISSHEFYSIFIDSVFYIKSAKNLNPLSVYLYANTLRCIKYYTEICNTATGLFPMNTRIMINSILPDSH